jgi:ketosteroid isomerase-like protein
MDPKELVIAFFERLNAHDVARLMPLLSDDHAFVNAAGEVRGRGREAMEQVWREYLEWFPDYRVGVDRVVAEGNVVALFGTVHGTPANDPAATWDIPAAWQCVVRDGRLSELRIYVDTHPMRQAAEPG